MKKCTYLSHLKFPIRLGCFVATLLAMTTSNRHCERSEANQKFSRFLSVILLSISFFSFNLFATKPLETFQLTSSAFQENGSIPVQYTGEGQDLSPPLAWQNVPKGTQSLAIICDDPDASGTPWVHWSLYNIPATLDHIEEGGKNLTPDILIGKNGWGTLAYRGPKPPSGVHHYHFTLYALDTPLKLKEGATKEELLKAMEGHILGESTLIGLYQSQKGNLEGGA